jgi:Mrp family chromosome partitioning ATPase
MLSFVPAVGEGSDYDPNVFTGALEILQAVTGLAHTGTVVIDLPPLSVSADAAAVGAALTGVLVVAAINRTTIDELTDSVRTLQARGVRVLGIVLNEGASKWQSFNVLSRQRKRRTKTV